MDTPKEVRKENRINRKNQKSEPIPLVNKWFGVLPFGIALILKNRKQIKH